MFGLPGAALADPTGQWDSLIGRVGPVCLVVERIQGAAASGGSEKKNVIKQGQKLRPNCASLSGELAVPWTSGGMTLAGTTPLLTVGKSASPSQTVTVRHGELRDHVIGYRISICAGL